ncbi:hypothetical protein EES41_35115 [Streptomyces sp. ADI95-16]|nr:hypothetical protein EES41_35115 [Streptomyces sp. ADI95-16]
MSDVLNAPTHAASAAPASCLAARLALVCGMTAGPLFLGAGTVQAVTRDRGGRVSACSG